MFKARKMCLGIIICLVFSSCLAQASLQVFPTRLVLSDKQKVANLSLRHKGAPNRALAQVQRYQDEIRAIPNHTSGMHIVIRIRSGDLRERGGAKDILFA